jgi:crotonobetainyl-CoA:carnitine CoA-transferase CaiB-like acyl-CoA transferase
MTDSDEEPSAEAAAAPALGESPLTGTRVVDYTTGVAGAMASRLLADLGAEVLLVEPPPERLPEGRRVRALGPFADDAASAEDKADAGGLHLALDAGKRSIVLDPALAADAERLHALVASADVFVEDAGPAAMAALGLDEAAAREGNPRLVYASHSPFGADGPYADRLSSEIVDYAMGGWMYFCGEPGKAPLLVPGCQAELHAGTQLATGALVALWEARRDGRGQQVEVSTFEASVSSHVFVISEWTQEGMVRRRVGTTVLPCADGHLLVTSINRAVFALLGEPVRATDPAIADPAGWRAAQPEVLARLAVWAAELPRDEIYRRAQEARVTGLTPIALTPELLDSPQHAAREWWLPVEAPEGAPVSSEKPLRIPGSPWRMSRSAVGPQARAPRLGEHSRGVDDDLAGDAPSIAKPTAEAGASGAGDGPLAGLTVLEVTSAWAGPLAGQYFADLGADVVIVEAPLAQFMRSWHFSGKQAWPRAHDRGHGFNQLNRNKRGVGIDLTTEGGRDAFLRLADRADVVVENNSPRVFPRLGIDYETLAARNPRLVLASISGFGASGPYTDYRAAGSTMEATTSIVARTGYGPGQLHQTGSFHTDPIAGTSAVAAVIAALLERERSGRGQHIEVSLFATGTLFSVESVMDHQLSCRVAGPLLNRSPRVAPQGAYRSAGDDCWLALACESDEQWAALCAVIGAPELVTAHPTLAERSGAHDAIDAAIEAWSSTLDHHEATRRLQAVGVPAGPVLANWEIASDPHLYARDYWVDTVHPEVGFQRYEGQPWRLSRSRPARRARPAPLFAQHNDEVLGGLAGLDAAALAALRASGDLLDEPTAMRGATP